MMNLLRQNNNRRRRLGQKEKVPLTKEVLLLALEEKKNQNSQNRAAGNAMKLSIELGLIHQCITNTTIVKLRKKANNSMTSVVPAGVLR